jgi:hypothetical protein
MTPTRETEPNRDWIEPLDAALFKKYAELMAWHKRFTERYGLRAGALARLQRTRQERRLQLSGDVEFSVSVQRYRESVYGPCSTVTFDSKLQNLAYPIMWRLYYTQDFGKVLALTVGWTRLTSDISYENVNLQSGRIDSIDRYGVPRAFFGFRPYVARTDRTYIQTASAQFKYDETSRISSWQGKLGFERIDGLNALYSDGNLIEAQGVDLPRGITADFSERFDISQHLEALLSPSGSNFFK